MHWKLLSCAGCCPLCLIPKLLCSGLRGFPLALLGTERAGWSPSRSECCCFVAFASLSPSQRVPADVAVLSTSLAPIGQRVLLWGGWVAGDFRWKMEPPGCVGRLGERCAPTPSFETWTFATLTRLMHGGSKSWLMDCHCSGEPSAATMSGACLEVARRKEARYPELVGNQGRARLVVLAGEVGGRFSSETAQFLGTSPTRRSVRCHSC